MHLISDSSKLHTGAVVSTPREIFGYTYRHLGIVVGSSRSGEWIVVSLSREKNGMTAETLSRFGSDDPVRVENFNGKLSPEEAAQRAWQTYLNRDIDYNLLRYNCEHLIYDLFGLPPQSPQLRQVIVSGVIAGMGIYALKS